MRFYLWGRLSTSRYTYEKILPNLTQICPLCEYSVKTNAQNTHKEGRFSVKFDRSFALCSISATLAVVVLYYQYSDIAHNRFISQ